jgi:hypothetical protein
MPGRPERAHDAETHQRCTPGIQQQGSVLAPRAPDRPARDDRTQSATRVAGRQYWCPDRARRYGRVSPHRRTALSRLRYPRGTPVRKRPPKCLATGCRSMDATGAREGTVNLWHRLGLAHQEGSRVG